MTINMALRYGALLATVQGASLALGGEAPIAIHPKVLHASAAATLCKAHDLKPLSRTAAAARKIYDIAMFNDELEMLDLHVGQMGPHVDLMVFVEGTKTFMCKDKELVLKENWDRYKEYHPVMLRHTIDYENVCDDGTDIPWGIERFSREQGMFRQVFDVEEEGSSSGKIPINRDDIIIVADLDEFMKPEVLQVMRNCVVPEKMTGSCFSHTYSFQWRDQQHHQYGSWEFPRAMLFKGNDTVNPQDLRWDWLLEEEDRKIHQFPNSSWHCTWCFPDIKRFLTKLDSYSHAPELQGEGNFDPTIIVEKVRRGLWFQDTKESNIIMFTRDDENLHDVPDFLLANKERFKYMLDRDPSNANFRDWDAKNKKLIENVAEPYTTALSPREIIVPYVAN